MSISPQAYCPPPDLFLPFECEFSGNAALMQQEQDRDRSVAAMPGITGERLTYQSTSFPRLISGQICNLSFYLHGRFTWFNAYGKVALKSLAQRVGGLQSRCKVAV